VAGALRRFAAALAVVVALGAGWRVALLLGPQAPPLDADEAIVGLMARHVLAGESFPLFYYGQHYLGALEAWCAAAAFALLGESTVALRTVPLAFSLVAIALVGVLGARTVSPRAGLLAALLFAIPPSGLALWCLKARGGFIELVALGTAVLIAADRLFFAGGGPRAAAVLAGLLALGWWVNQQIVYYALPVLAWSVWRGRDHALVREWLPPLALGAVLAMVTLPVERPPTLGGRLLLGVAVASALLAVAAVLRRRGAGGGAWLLPVAALVAATADDLPLLAGRPGLESVAVIGLLAVAVLGASWGASEGIAAATAVAGALGVAILAWWSPRAPLYSLVPLGVVLPLVARRIAAEPHLRAATLGALVGGIPFAAGFASHGLAVFDVLRGTGGQGFAGQLGGFFTTSLPMLVGARPFWAELDFAPGLSLAVLAVYLASIPAFVAACGRRAGFLVAFLVGVPIVFATSGFGWFAREPRYLLPIYSVLFLVPAAAADRALERGRAWLGVLAIAALLAVHGATGLAVTGRDGGGFQLTEHERVARDHREVLDFLAVHGIERVYTSYWIGYRLAFESGERILASSFEQPATERIASHEHAVRRADSVAYLLPPSRARLVELALDGLGIGYRRESVAGYRILFDLERPGDERPARPLPLSPASLRASTSAEALPLAVDGELDTRWATHGPQRPGTWFEVRFDEPVALAWAALSVGDYRLDHPRGLEVRIEDGDGAWRTIASSARDPGLGYWLQGGRLELDLGGARASALRFVQTGVDEVFDWSIAEVRVWSAAGEGEGEPG
jgi:hypothetical protein